MDGITKRIILTFLLLLSTGCTAEQDPTIKDLESFITQEQTFEEKKEAKEEQKKHLKNWFEIDQGLSIKEIEITGQEDEILDTVTITKIDPEYYEFTLVKDAERPKAIINWQKELQADIVVNGGYFKEDNTSSGGLKIRNEQTGVLTLDGENGYTATLSIQEGAPQLHYLPEQPLEKENLPDYLVQSYPTLIKPGAEPYITEDSGKKARRTIIAQNSAKEILFIHTHKQTFSLFEIMNFLIESDLDIQQAFNLDGGPSTGLSINHNEFEYLIPSFAVPNVISINKKDNAK